MQNEKAALMENADRNNWSSHNKTYPSGILSTITPTSMAWGRNCALAVTGWSLSPIWHNLTMN